MYKTDWFFCDAKDYKCEKKSLICTIKLTVIYSPNLVFASMFPDCLSNLFFIICSSLIINGDFNEILNPILGRDSSL